MHLRAFVAAAALGAACLVAVGPAGPAAAVCPEVGNVYYTFSQVSTSRKMSNLRSDYLKGPGTISYSKSKTAEVNASMSASVEAEAGVVFAKASASIGTSVGASWSKSGTWSYSKDVPAGKTAQLVMYHTTKKFVVTKKKIVAPCTLVTVYTSSVNAPVKTSTANVWDLNYL
jgi:hypothetical protein